MRTSQALSFSSGTLLQKELFRKLLHMAIIAVPFFAKGLFFETVFLLVAGICVYIVVEAARVQGHRVGLISQVTEFAARPMERGFIWGPVTLIFGTLATLLFFPHPAAVMGICALGFGDGVAGLAGKLWGGKTSFESPGEKTLIGFLACFLAVFPVALLLFDSLQKALLIAAAVALLEFVSQGDMDNLIVPLGTGYLATILL